MTRTLCLMIVGSYLLSGCADAAKESADRDVQKLLADRKEKTLGYQPEAVASTTVDPKTTKKSYESLPVTEIAPRSLPPLEPARLILRYEALGPVQLFPDGTIAPQMPAFRVSTQYLGTADKYRLGPPSAPRHQHTFELFQSLAYAVQHSRDYQTKMEDLYLAALDVTLERHLFEPRPFAGAGLRYDGGQKDVNYRSALSATATAGVRQQLPYGGEIVATSLVSFVNALNDATANGESASVGITASIPLLRGAGMVNLEPLIESERQLVYEVRNFEDFRRSFAVDLSTRYLRLLSQQQAIINRRFNYAALADLTERTQALYSAGRVNFLQYQRALQQLLSGESSLIDALVLYDTDLDDFKILIGMPVDESLDIVAIQLAVGAPDIEHIDAAQLALTYRLDLQTTRDQIEDARRRVAVAKNGLLPELNFNGNTRVTNPNDSLAKELNGQTMTYTAGLDLNLPIDNVSERNAYRRSLIQLERAQRSYSLQSDTIVADVRTAVRGIRSATMNLAIQQQSISLAKRRVDYANDLLTQGRSTSSQDVTDAQSSLLSAQDQYERAKANLQIQVLQFLRDTGTLRVDPEAGTLGVKLDRSNDQSTQ